MTAVRPFRHRDSPRIRRRARDWGVELGELVGTGPGGRVTEDDLRAATAAAAAPAAPGPLMPAGGIAALQIALPSGSSPDRAALVSSVAVAALAALRRRGVEATAVGRTALDGTAVDGTAVERTAVVDGAHDLTADALRRRLDDDPPDAPCHVRVVDAGAVDAQVALPRPGERAVLAVGGVRENVAVERGADGMIAFVARAAVTITIATAAQLPESISAFVLRQVARALTSA